MNNCCKLLFLLQMRNELVWLSFDDLPNRLPDFRQCFSWSVFSATIESKKAEKTWLNRNRKTLEMLGNSRCM